MKPLLSEKVDSIYVDGIEKVDNKIQQTSLMTILKNLKKFYDIETIEDLLINPKEKNLLIAISLMI